MIPCVSAAILSFYRFPSCLMRLFWFEIFARSCSLSRSLLLSLPLSLSLSLSFSPNHICYLPLKVPKSLSHHIVKKQKKQKKQEKAGKKKTKRKSRGYHQAFGVQKKVTDALGVVFNARIRSEWRMLKEIFVVVVVIVIVAVIAEYASSLIASKESFVNRASSKTAKKERKRAVACRDSFRGVCVCRVRQYPRYHRLEGEPSTSGDHGASHQAARS